LLESDAYLSHEPNALEGPEDWEKVEHKRVGVGGVVTGEETHFVLKLNYNHYSSI
jgi:hypothetical protein